MKLLEGVARINPLLKSVFSSSRSRIKVLPNHFVAEPMGQINRLLAEQLGRMRILKGIITGLEWYGGNLRAVWLDHDIVYLDKASPEVSKLRLNCPAQLVVIKKQSKWFVREAIPLPLQPTLVELEPLKTPTLVGFTVESISDEPHYPQQELRYI